MALHMPPLPPSLRIKSCHRTKLIFSSDFFYFNNLTFCQNMKIDQLSSQTSTTKDNKGQALEIAEAYRYCNIIGQIEKL